MDGVLIIAIIVIAIIVGYSNGIRAEEVADGPLQRSLFER
jgi:hypothetical protein